MFSANEQSEDEDEEGSVQQQQEMQQAENRLVQLRRLQIRRQELLRRQEEERCEDEEAEETEAVEEEETEEPRRRFDTFKSVSRAILLVIKVCNMCRDCLSNSVLQEEELSAALDSILFSAEKVRNEKHTFSVVFLDPTTKMMSELSFDRSEFERGHISANALSQSAREAFRVSPGIRTDADLREIIKCIRFISEPFRAYATEIQKRMIQVADFDRFLPNRTLLKSGLPADGFYILLLGTLVEHHYHPERYSEELKVGCKFGEQDLICGCPRKTTVITKSYVEVIHIHRFDYGFVFGIREVEKNGEMQALLSDLMAIDPVLMTLPIDIVARNTGMWSVLEYKTGKLIAQDSNKVDWIYIICDGHAQVIKTAQTENSRSSSTVTVSSKSDLSSNRRRLLQSAPIRRQSFVLGSSLSMRPKSTIGSTPNYGQNYGDHRRRKISNSKSVVLPKFLQIQLLRRGGVFGLRSCLPESLQGPSTSLISGGCEVLHLNRAFVQRFFGSMTHRLIDIHHPAYPSDLELKRKLNTKLQWLKFKSDTLKKTVQLVSHK